ncbi:alanine racemase [Erysipelotrichaceae bacterium OH741_COT-311]|nr:alanine racemase [Erysipelotrichaceae bacterium OH741_COT-311]
MLYRDSWIQFNLDHLIYNIHYIKKKTNKKLMAVIKANGYGNGDIEVAKSAIEANIDYLCVSSLDEALNLRQHSIDVPILILGYVNPSYSSLLIEHSLTTTVVSIDWIHQLITDDIKDLKVHIKIDTGLNRIGLKTIEELQQAMLLLKEKGVVVEGIFTHFACSDQKDQTFTKQQYSLFKEFVKSCTHTFTYIHTNNTDASLSFDADITNCNRVGLGIYGYSSYDKQLKPCVSLYSKVIHCKKIKQGEYVSYGITYQAQKDEYILTIPIGYADGWIRKNQNRKVWIHGTLCTIVGRICMDQCMIQSDVFYPVGTVVELFGPHISLETVASELDTISYEVLTLLSDRLGKVYIKDNKETFRSTPRFDKL